MSRAKLISPITKQGLQKKRVAAYCRVSSNSADQLNSYANQIRVYTKLLNSKQEWQMVEIFADEGLSGTKADNRDEFQRMIHMCELHQIDLIITKSVARFARNVKESLEYVRKLKLLGVGVQFEKEGINTLAMGDEMLLNTFTAIAQEESHRTSVFPSSSVWNSVSMWIAMLPTDTGWRTRCLQFMSRKPKLSGGSIISTCKAGPQAKLPVT